MVSGGSRVVVIVGILIGATLAGGVIGAGVDYISGNSGWWGVGALIGLMAGAVTDSVLTEAPGKAA